MLWLNVWSLHTNKNMQETAAMLYKFNVIHVIVFEYKSLDFKIMHANFTDIQLIIETGQYPETLNFSNLVTKPSHAV